MLSKGEEKGSCDSGVSSNGSNGGSLKQPNNSKRATLEIVPLLKSPPPKEQGGNSIKNVFTRNGQFPGCVYFIIAHVFCERASYYSSRAILVLYLTRFLDFDEDSATAMYHAFVMLCYFSAPIGAMVADGWLGKYKTILCSCFIYAAGSITMAITALPPLGAPDKVGPLIALLLISLGIGGLGPSVSAFGGDQFSANQEGMIQLYFNMFFFSTNAGAVIFFYLIPQLRSDVQCYGDDCYSLAFGITAGLILAATLLFVAGTSMYKKNPPSGNMIGLVFRTIMSALKNKFTSQSREKRNHWLDWASDNYERDLVEDIKIVLHVMVLFLPLPMFFALSEQYGSRWTLQAEKMDGSLGPIGNIKPDQMQVTTALLILIFIPTFKGIVYPLLAKCNLLVKPLQRMGAGMFLVGASFLIAGLIELRLERTPITVPPVGKADLRIIHTSPCDLKVQGENNYNVTLSFAQTSGYQRLDAGSQDLTLVCAGYPDLNTTVNLKSQSKLTVAVRVQNGELKDIQFYDAERRPKQAVSQVRLLLFMLDGALGNDANIILEGPHKYTILRVAGTSDTNLISMVPGSYRVLVAHNDSNYKRVPQELVVNTGGVYTTILMLNNTQARLATFQDVSPYQMSMLWQIPQYVVLTAGAVLFCVTVLEFSFTQAPESMKSVMQAIWLLSSGFGNLITFTVADLRLFASRSSEFFFFAGLMGVVDIIFIILAVRYKYVTPRSGKDDELALVAGTAINARDDEYGSGISP
ncbi:solute carrier family 15 member 1-like isoform X2 [Branchiostoma lanceolatum]